MTRMLVAALLFAAVTFTSTAFADETTKPNIVVILADDLGYGDVHALNATSKIPTPNLDRIAAEGMTFTDAHTGSAVCTPTRYGLVTGRYCWRTRLKSGVLNGYSTHLIDEARTTVADKMKSAGYTTGIVGKWHLGLDFAPAENGRWRFDYTKPIAHGPHVLGFDYFYGIPASLDFPPYVYVENDRVVELPTVDQPAQGFPAYLRAGERQPMLVMENCLDDLAAKANAFIEQHADDEAPFFLYFPLTAPHKPVLPHPRFRGKTDLGPYGDFVMQVDATVGTVLDTLDETGIADNTLVIVTSDNGSFMYRRDGEPDHLDDETLQQFNSDHHTSNYVFRGTKADVWEGGHHVPFLVRWPGVVKPDSECSQTVCLVDIFATCADIVGLSLNDDEAEDSFSLLPLLEGAKSINRAPVIHHSAAGMFAIRDGKWKLVAGNGSGGREQPKGKPFQQPYPLFDMEADISETTDLAEENPGVVEQLTDKLQGIIDNGRSR